jgi:hypothetical protein
LGDSSVTSLRVGTVVAAAWSIIVRWPICSVARILDIPGIFEHSATTDS